MPLPKIQLVICKRNAVILPFRISSHALLPPSPLLLLLPLQPSLAPPPPLTITTKEEELKWAFINNKFIDISLNYLLSSNNTIKDLEECDINSLLELL